MLNRLFTVAYLAAGLWAAFLVVVVKGDAYQWMTVVFGGGPLLMIAALHYVVWGSL